MPRNAATSDLFFKGVLGDRGRSVWRGVIQVADELQVGAPRRGHGDAERILDDRLNVERRQMRFAVRLLHGVRTNAMFIHRQRHQRDAEPGGDALDEGIGQRLDAATAAARHHRRKRGSDALPSSMVTAPINSAAATAAGNRVARTKGSTGQPVNRGTLRKTHPAGWAGIAPARRKSSRLACVGGTGMIALVRGETVNAIWFVFAAVCCGMLANFASA